MAGLRLTVVDAGPLSPDKNKLVAFAPGTVSVPTTVGIIEHPKHGLILSTDCGFFRAAKFAWKPPRSWIFSRCPRIG